MKIFQKYITNIFFYGLFLLDINGFKSYPLSSDHELVVSMDYEYFNNLSVDYYLKKRPNDADFKSNITNIKRILIVCPVSVTGGPENLCQLFSELKENGFEAYFLWVNSPILKKYKEGNWYICGNDLDITPSIYKQKYHIKHLDHDLILDKSTLIIVPEIWCDFLPFFELATKMIAWLSIGFIHVVNRSETCRILIEQKKMYLMDCYHLAQAPWIEKTLLEWGATSYLLGDYISNEYSSVRKENKIDFSIAYFPRKGGSLAQKFIEKNEDYNYIRLENLSVDEMIIALDRSKIYIDFGFFPGRDRVPREALLRDCVIFIHNIGCAADYDSFPIDNYFRFSDQDVIDGTLSKKIEETFVNYEKMQSMQSSMQKSVAGELSLFKERVKDIFQK